MVLLSTACLLITHGTIQGQESYDLEGIYQAYHDGYKQSIRDLFISYADNPSADKLREIQQGCLFDLQDADFLSMSPEQWSTYYYQHQHDIKYYDEWGVYLRNDLPLPNLPYAVLDNHASPSLYIAKPRQIYNAVSSKSLKKLVPIVEALSIPETMYGQRILLESLQVLTESHACNKMMPVYAAISAKLVLSNDQFVHQRIDQIIKQSECNTKIQKCINETIGQQKANSPIYKDIHKQLPIYRNSAFITHLKEQIYSATYKINAPYFDDKVDYYGKLLSAVELNDKIDEDEMIFMLIQTRASKSLYHLASRWFKYAKTGDSRAAELMDVLNSLIDSNIQVNTPTGKAYNCDNQTKDLLAQKAILTFWLNNYKHYEWNDDLNKFINTNILKKDRQELVQLYKSLNGNNSDVALKSYWKLVQSDPILLAEVDNIYGKKLLKYNRDLPSQKYKYLLQLARLVQYCKSNGLEYRINKTLAPLLSTLSSASEIADIIRLEVDIADQLNPKNITAFEIWSIINSGKDHIPYSTTKITNLFYKNNLTEIIKSENDLNLFLKKANLFKYFGDHGSSKYYLKKIVDHPNININQIKLIKTKSLDDDILASAEYVSNYIDSKNSKSQSIPFEDFIKSPSSYTQEDLENITVGNKNALSRFIASFETRFTEREKFIILEWIHVHLPEGLITFTINLKTKSYYVISRQEIEVEIKDYASQILSSYISKNIDQSDNWSKEHTKVFSDIYLRDLGIISTSDEIEIETINDIINSRFYSTDSRALILNALPKVKPSRNITACDLKTKLTLSELKTLLPQIQSRNALDYLLKITDVNNNDDLVDFLIDRANTDESIEAGRFFNDLFKKQWFAEYIDSNVSSSDLKIKIQWILTGYWESEAGLSAFEEEQTVLNIIKIELAGKTTEEKIELILASFVDNEIKLQTLRKIVNQVDYKSIPLLLNYYDEITEIGGLELFKFINEDFGIPIQDISDRQLMQTLSTDLVQLSEKDLYLKYLAKIGIELKSERGEFNLNKAYSIITEDLVRPFVGTGGSVRDIYVFGTIKLLELELNKTLGFHPKLNESQSFYKYTSKKRAQAWAENLSYLADSPL